MSPNSQAINLIAGFASGHVKVDGDELKRLPTIHEPESTKNAKTAQKEPQKTSAKQMAEKEPHTKIADSEIKLEYIIPGSPVFIPNKHTTPKGKGKGIKDIKINMSSKNSDSDMARRKCTKTKEELETEAKGKARAKHRALFAKQSAGAAKAACRSPKVCKNPT